MEWWKLFGSTFILIFLAELGDKTQLAAMAKTADSPGDSSAKWVVFLAASTALVASTFIAVFLGHILKSLVPDERYIKIAAGTLFLIFGAKILYDVHASFKQSDRPATAAASDETMAEPGLVGGLAIRAAMDFESLSGERYRRLAASAPPSLATLLTTLAGEEDSHLARLRGLPETNSSDTRVSERLLLEVKGHKADTSNTSEVIGELIRHEEATADFYQSLADRSFLPSLRPIFTRLADEERAHAGKLRTAMENEQERGSV